MPCAETEPRGQADPGLNPRRLADFLAESLDAEVTVAALHPVTAGARRTNVVFEATVDGTETGFCVTQLPNDGEAFRSIEDEVGWLRLAAELGVTVAEVIAWNGADSPLGGPFFVTRRVDGVTIPKQVIELCEATPGLGASVAHRIGESLARLHQAPVAAVPAGVERPATDAVQAALDWADEAMGELLARSPAFELTLRWLRANRPDPMPACPIHGDVRNGNIIVNPAGLGAILDWETAQIGEPFQDLGWLAQRMWRARRDGVEIGGFADRSDLRAGYEAGGGTWDLARFEWWKLFRTLWWGLGLANQARQHLDGTFRSIVMAASGRRVAELEWDCLCLLGYRDR